MLSHLFINYKNFISFFSLSGIPTTRRESNGSTALDQSDFPSVPDHDGTTAAAPTVPDCNGITAAASLNNSSNCQPLVMPSTTCCASAGSFLVPCLHCQGKSDLFLTADSARQTWKADRNPSADPGTTGNATISIRQTFAIIKGGKNDP